MGWGLCTLGGCSRPCCQKLLLALKFRRYEGTQDILAVAG